MPKDKESNLKPPNVKGFQVYWIYIILGILIISQYLFLGTATVKVITWQEFENRMLSRHAVEKIVVINNEDAEVFIRKEFLKDTAFKDIPKTLFKNEISAGPHYKFNIGSVDSFEKKLEDAEKDFAKEDKIDVAYIKRSNWMIEILGWILPLVIMLMIIRYSFRRMSIGSGTNTPSVFSFGKSTATLMEKENKSTITFNDVAGLIEAKMEVKEIVDFLTDPGQYTRLGAKIPKGVIIIGPPGTGKTLLVKAVAGEANVPFFSISGSEFVEMFVGVGASRVRDLFKRAKEKAPSIIFIDEIDAVGRSRGKNALYSGANDERESTLNQLLTEMDGFGTNSGVIVLAATNRADMLDPALLRPGRFDRHIYLELPTVAERKEIFKVHIRSLVLDDSVDLDILSRETPGCSGADIANICNEAALIAARAKKEKIGRQDFFDAIDRIIAGAEQKTKIISPSEKKIIAFHESGHAVVSWMLKNVDPLLKVSIVPRGKSLGAAFYLPEERQLKSMTEFNDTLCAALGGRAAEEIIFGDVTSGALDDLVKVTRQAYTMIAYLGFNKKIGNVSFYNTEGEQTFQKPFSEETGKIIDEEVRQAVTLAYERAKNILQENKDLLTKLATHLLEKEVAYKEDLDRILGKRPGSIT